jgi:hypothetical protein
MGARIKPFLYSDSGAWLPAKVVSMLALPSVPPEQSACENDALPPAPLDGLPAACLPLPVLPPGGRVLGPPPVREACPPLRPPPEPLPAPPLPNESLPQWTICQA